MSDPQPAAEALLVPILGEFATSGDPFADVSQLVDAHRVLLRASEIDAEELRTLVRTWREQAAEAYVRALHAVYSSGPAPVMPTVSQHRLLCVLNELWADAGWPDWTKGGPLAVDVLRAIFFAEYGEGRDLAEADAYAPFIAAIGAWRSAGFPGIDESAE